MTNKDKNIATDPLLDDEGQSKRRKRGTNTAGR
jgi:hypothetical protein